MHLGLLCVWPSLVMTTDDSRAVVCTTPQGQDRALDVEQELSISSSYVASSLTPPDIALLEEMQQANCAKATMDDGNTSLLVCPMRNTSLRIRANPSTDATIARTGDFNQTQWQQAIASGLAWQWLTLKSGKVVRAAVNHYTQGDMCGAGRRRMLQTFTYCKRSVSVFKPGEICRPSITWAGIDDGMRAYSMASWMRYSHCYNCPAAAEVCALRAHIALPASCRACSSEVGVEVQPDSEIPTKHAVGHPQFRLLEVIRLNVMFNVNSR